MKNRIQVFFRQYRYDYVYICALAILFSFVGWIVENGARCITYGIIDNRFHLLPFIPVYGLIAIAAYMFGNPDKLSIFGFTIIKKDTLFAKIVSNILLLCICFGLTFVGELAIGNLWEKLFGVVLWNYEGHPLHLTKYVSVYSVLGFGLGSYLFIRFIYYPLLVMLKNRTSYRNARVFPILYGILLCDMIFMMVRTAILGEGPVYWSINLREGFSVFAILEGSLVTIFVIFVILFGASNYIYLKEKDQVYEENKKNTKFAILIPARNESKVIGATLDALMASNYPKDSFTVYVMVSSEDDPTLEICKNYSNVVASIRKTTDVGKGYVLDEMIKEILASDMEYDSYLLLDADNLVDSNYLRCMSNAFLMGYDIVVGCRTNKNPNTSATSGASGITFTIINHMNQLKSKNHEMVLLTGTGFCIRSGIINQEGGWPFHSLTEDYELSMYAKKNGLSSAYTKDAIFYDEQPIKLSDSIKQRTRWIKGFMSNNKEKKSFSLSSFSGFGIAITYILYVLLNLFLAVFDLFRYKQFEGFKIVLISIVFYYVLVALISFMVFILDRKKSKITFHNAIKASLFHPIFLATYLVSFIRIFRKGREWEEIPHSVNKL